MGSGKDILFEKFEIIECLKKDSSAGVYVAFHIYLGKKILLKTLDRTKISDPAMMKRFQREAKTLARLDFDNIIKVLDFGVNDMFFYISFEYFPSRNLRQVIDENALSRKQKQLIFRQIVKGVAFAHLHKIIHRDLKPENILVNDSMQVKVADFGLALIEGEESFTVQTSIVGTPGYMSPEQIRGEELTAQSDLFSLGVVGYELFAGVNPFIGKDAGATLHNILAPTSNLEMLRDIPDPDGEMIASLLKKSKSERLRTIGEAVEMLGGAAAASEPAGDSASKSQSSRIMSRVFLGALAIFILTAAIFLLFIRPEKIADDLETALMSQSDSAQAAAKLEAETFHHDPEFLADSSQSVESAKSPPPEDQPIVDARPGRLLIKCSPWAYVFIDSIKTDTTPMEEPALIAAGEHEIRLEHPNFPAYMKKIRISSGEELKVAVDLDTLFGYFACDIFPWGDIYLDDAYRGQTPLRALAVEPGRHTLVVKNQQYDSVVDTFVVLKQDTFYFQHNFERSGVASSSNP